MTLEIISGLALAYRGDLSSRLNHCPFVGRLRPGALGTSGQTGSVKSSDVYVPRNYRTFSTICSLVAISTVNDLGGGVT